MNLIHGILGLLGCQLLGEIIAQLAGLPVPGPVIGMLLLLAFLLGYGGPPAALRRVSETLLNYLALLFVPAGVGVMVHFRLIAGDWVAIGAALVVSTAVTLVATMLALRGMLALRRRGHG